jgi:hypothetical protein
MRCNSLDDLSCVEYEQVGDFGALTDSDIVHNTQGLSEKIELTSGDINHLVAGGIIIASINGSEYCLVIVEKGA